MSNVGARWRSDVLSVRGAYCRACYATGSLEIDHLVPRAHGGPYEVPNGIPWCPACHRLKTDHRLLVSRSMLDPDQVAWLAANGYAWWDDAGEVYGLRRRIFAAERSQ